MKRSRYMTLLVVMVSLYVAVVIISYVWVQRIGTNVINLDRQWQVYHNDALISTQGDKSIGLKERLTLQRGDEIVYVTTLKGMPGKKMPSLLFTSRYCSYEIYLGDQCIASRYDGRFDSGDYIGREQRIVTLPLDYAGQELKIVTKINSPHTVSGMTNSFLGDRPDLEKGLLQYYAVAFCSGIFLILFGAIYLFIIFIMLSWMPMMKSYIPLAVLTVVMGIMLHTKYSGTSLFMNTELTSRLYDLSIFLVIPIGILCGQAVCRKDKNKAIRIVEGLVIVVAALLIIMHLARRFYIYDAYRIFFVLSIVSLVLLLIRTIRVFRHFSFTDSEWLLLASLWVALFFPLLSLSLDGMVVLGVLPDTFFMGMLNCNLFCVGPVFLGYFLLLDFLVNISNVHSKKQEYESLTYLAYSDDLTGLANRAKYTRYLEALEKEQANYCIISFDVDGLKDVNDTYGHAAGDRLLKTFARVLGEVYGDAFIARIGGDEFAAVLEHDEEYNSIETIRNLQEKLEELNEEGTDPWHYGASAGYAYRHESEGDYIHQTYLMADQRMYEDKKHRKQAREDV